VGVPSQHAGADITRANVDGSTLICRYAVNVEATVGRIFSDYDIILFLVEGQSARTLLNWLFAMK